MSGKLNPGGVFYYVGKEIIQSFRELENETIHTDEAVVGRGYWHGATKVPTGIKVKFEKEPEQDCPDFPFLPKFDVNPPECIYY